MTPRIEGGPGPTSLPPEYRPAWQIRPGWEIHFTEGDEWVRVTECVEWLSKAEGQADVIELLLADLTSTTVAMSERVMTRAELSDSRWVQQV